MSASHDFLPSSRIPLSAPYSPAPSHSSMADPSQQARGQPSYPSPHSYPSPQMPAYTYPPPQGQSSEPYRSPQGSNMNLPPLNLPPIRLDGQQPPPPQPQPGQPPMGSPLPPPQHGMPQYYAHPGHPQPGQPMNMGNQHLAMRYPLPPQAGEQRILSGGRHKKEIKRRTKTGCLTCRKRRIKCDEAHPVCRNCQKSKRDCLGYDPIFKQQPGPPQIQPAPNSAPHQTSVPASAPPTTAPYSGQVPQGYAPAGTAGYAQPAPPPGSAHPPHENFNSSAIDPALAAADPAMHGQPPYNGVHAVNHALRGNSYSAPSDGQIIKGKPLKITDIFSIANHSPPEVPSRPTPIPAELNDEFSNIFSKDYCAGLDVLLETRWYSTNNNALNRVFADKSLHEEAIFFTETVKYRAGGSDMSGVFSQEARLIWHLLGSCKHPAPASTGTNGAAPNNAENEDLALREARARFDILEALLTNQPLDSNPLRQLAYPPDVREHKKMELDFWESLGEFLVHADAEAAPAGPAEHALGRMRNVLHAVEARDAIYSIAVARQAGNRLRGFPNSLPAPVDQNPESDLNKVHVAMSFISHECRAGSQQVIARVCDMAMLSWTVSRAI